MDPTIIAAMITAVVAVAGIIGTIVGQGRAAANARRESLAASERQAIEQNRIRAEQAQEQRDLTLLADRQRAYAKFMADAWEMWDGQLERDKTGSTAREGEAMEAIILTQMTIRLIAPAATIEVADNWAVELVQAAPVRLTIGKMKELEAAFVKVAGQDVKGSRQELEVRRPDVEE